MLGWFKRKFSKKKKQETSLEQEPVATRDDAESPVVSEVGDGKEAPAQEDLISESVEEEANAESDSGGSEDIPSTSPPDIEKWQSGQKESVASEEPGLSRESSVEEPLGVMAETQDEPDVRPDNQVLPAEEQPAAEQEHAEAGQEIVTEEEVCEEETAITSADEAPSAVTGPEETAAEDSSPEQVDEVHGPQESAELHESPVLMDEHPEEESLDKTLTALIADADEETDSLEEPTSEAEADIVDQTLEELLAPDQPDEDVGATDVIADQESSAAEQDVEPDLLHKEGTELETKAQPTVAGEEEDTIVDQPLEELLADEQADDVAGLAEEATGLTGPEKEQPEQEQEPQPVEETAAAAVTADKPTRKSLFQRLQERLGKTRQGLLYRLDSIFLGKKEIDEDLLDELEEILITSDLGVATTMDLLDAARRQVKRKELSDPQALKKILRDKILGYLLASDQPAELVMPESGPFVIMVVGVNGVGKTTTIGKIANKFKESGQTVLLIAADTFRAAAIDQLKIWAQRVGTDIIASKPGADPSSVVFDGLDYGVKNDFDAIIIDTAGRLHTSVNLMEELKKIKRVIGKKMEGAPHEVLLVLDATTGQNGISQAKLFGEAVGVSGLALTKLDGTAKGGIVANVCRELKIPVRFIGIGEQMDDLRDFDAHEFVDALFAEEAGANDRSAAA